LWMRAPSSHGWPDAGRLAAESNTRSPKYKLS
jgi:hypothetical protein